MAETKKATRLEPIREEPDYTPWVRAATVEDCSIFWLPVSGFPMQHDERVWLLQFLEAFSVALKDSKGLREEVFLQFSTANETLGPAFRKYVQRVQFLPGLSRTPGESLRGIPDLEEVQKEIQENKAFDMAKWTADYAVWFQYKRATEQRELFLGAGGLTLLFLAPDPKTIRPPLPFSPRFRASMPVFQHIDVDGMVEGAYSLHDKFLPQSKELFGKGLNTEISLESIGFVLPLLDSGHLLAALPEVRDTWFELFDVYCRESPKDQGIVLAFRNDYRSLLAALLADFSARGIVHPSQMKIRSGTQVHPA